MFAILILIFSTISFSYDESSSYAWSSTSITKEVSSSDVLEANSEIENNNALNLESGSAILMEQSTGQILYSHNIHEQLRPASVTKIMSILLIMEQIDNGYLSYSDSVSCSETARSMGGSQIWLDPRETLTVDEMLKAICVVSANDCVVAMAEHIAGSEEAFVQMMNDKAKELGMNDTCFKNCHGIDEDGHVTSSYDIALMSRELLDKHSDITKYTTIWMDSLRSGKSQLVNTNKLIRTYKGITGLKTGSTSLALYNLSASATRNDLSLIAVIMKAPSTKVRFSEAQKLLDYGFNKFSFKSFGNKDDVIQNVSVNKGVKSTVDAILESNAGTLIEKGKESQISQSIEINKNIEAPISKGDKIGQVTFTLDGQELSSVNLVASKDIDKINLFTMSKKVIYSWIDLLRS
ncbi:MAG: D-alanyl-D-alanine carboxypeptidase [Clostridia bacterium]|nr:D-alanyl-D-alanine carboxypeptidase [Clostridia bacterium]